MYKVGKFPACGFAMRYVVSPDNNLKWLNEAGQNRGLAVARSTSVTYILYKNFHAKGQPSAGWAVCIKLFILVIILVVL